MPTEFLQRQFDRLSVEVYPSEAALGQAAAHYAAVALQTALAARGQANLIVATGNSQLSFLAALAATVGLNWSRIRIFHMDEYRGLASDHPAAFRRFLRDKLVTKVQPAFFYELAGDSADPVAEAARYTALLRTYPADLCCLGFGENGHLAFNEPGSARFDDPEWVKVVPLNEASRVQQVGEGHFPTLAAVPTHALSLTIPALLAASQVLAIVPEARKAAAVAAALTNPISVQCPASILRQAPHARLLVDRDSFARVGTPVAP